ncbi:Glycerophosphodiester phosphodiesterase domain-containing protein 5 [Bagarius yarrelli]|uniref:Glycerophosphodiester phosphodiesterase domain-containing protein 5 n=1 Tax=Bagarius yarrelli TaxID=175774 RepID=A0A556U3I3_BAGYA|nr:Glycerophosphodiester phosphodiesterase domain-containing protein 5 [Bagarius yarrelli]
MDRSSLRSRPSVIGRRGAPMLAPENTIMSFNKALQQRVSGFHADVTISADGVAFLMRDRTLRRTTDVARDDPYWTVRFMSVKERGRAANQTVCSLVELLRLAAKTNRSVMLNLRRPPPQHPRHEYWISDALKALQRSGIQFDQVEEEKVSSEEFKGRGTRAVSLHYSQATPTEIRRFSGGNVSVNVYPVNEPWLYSLLWCSGVQSVSSDAPHILRKVPQPIWLMTPDEYCLIWIMADLISAAVIIAIFIFQRWRISGMRSYNPEQIMLSAVVRRPSRDVNIMKEKLIFSEINNGVSSTDELPLYTDHRYEEFTCDPVPR